jgi:hypothetical protein
MVNNNKRYIARIAWDMGFIGSHGRVIPISFLEKYGIHVIKVLVPFQWALGAMLTLNNMTVE